MPSASSANFLQDLFAAAVKAADPAHCLPAHLPDPPKGKTIVIGAGKAAASMARAVEQNWRGDVEALSGLVITRYGHGADCSKIEVVEAAHPIPDAAGQQASMRIVEMVSGLGPDDMVLCLMSGGGSALLSLPAPGLNLDDKQTVNRALLKSGATIDEMNTVRKHLSAVKGGQLAQMAAPARLITLAISDVPGDDPSIIASGPTVPDSTTSDEALAILKRYDISPARTVMTHLRSARSETPKPGDPVFAGSTFNLVARPQDALEAAAGLARARGITPLVLGDAIEGEAREVAIVHGAIARQIATHNQPVNPPAVILSGGETTVTVRGAGRGGRNCEFLLALAVYLDGLEKPLRARIHALACDTDGIDGTEDNAGALLTPDLLARAARTGLNARSLLADNDSYSYFEKLDALIKTGPTYTNVNDFRAVLVEP